MANYSLENELKRLQKREREVSRQLRIVDSQLKERERKRRSTMLVAYGLLVLDELDRGIRSRESLMRDLDRVLKQPSHRAAVGLPALDPPGTNDAP
jgi:hypothetical protein